MNEKEILQEEQGDVTNQVQAEEQSLPQQTSDTSYSAAIISVVVVALLIIAGLVGWYFYFMNGEQVIEDFEQPTGLGAELFEEVDNPIEDQIPTVQTTVNPIEDIYKNPFE